MAGEQPEPINAMIVGSPVIILKNPSRAMLLSHCMKLVSYKIVHSFKRKHAGLMEHVAKITIHKIS